MTTKIKKQAHSASFKFKVALEAVRGEKTSAELCQEFGIASSQLFKWRRDLLDHGSEIFNKSAAKKGSISTEEIDKLHAAIGRLKVENDFLSKFAGGGR